MAQISGGNSLRSPEDYLSRLEAVTHRRRPRSRDHLVGFLAHRRWVAVGESVFEVLHEVAVAKLHLGRANVALFSLELGDLVGSDVAIGGDIFLQNDH